MFSSTVAGGPAERIELCAELLLLWRLRILLKGNHTFTTTSTGFVNKHGRIRVCELKTRLVSQKRSPLCSSIVVLVNSINAIQHEIG